MPTDRDNAIMWARQILAQKLAVILDTETTGLNGQAEIVQIAVINIAGEILLNSLVKPILPIPPEVTAIHGITNAQVKDAPNWPQVYPQLQMAVNGRTLIIYNASFDQRLIYQTSKRHNLSIAAPYFNPARVDCAMLIYSEYVGEWNNYYQSYKWQRLEGGDHSALGDCRATLALIKRMAANSLESEQGPFIPVLEKVPVLVTTEEPAPQASDTNQVEP